MRLDFVVAIPARYSSTRLPGKPLRLLAGEPMILHVARRALLAGAREVWVATDDERIREALRDSDVNVAMTSPDHASGTDRLAECAQVAGWSDGVIVVNLQGDEPFAPASGIRTVAAALAEGNADMATLAAPVEEPQQLFDPNTVKLVCNDKGEALYFSRAPIPWHRDGFVQDREVLSERVPWLRHIGIYAYRAGFLRRFAAMPQGALEWTESLEQLRALEAGHRIAVALTPEPFPHGVDTPEDLLRAEARIREGAI